MAARRKAKNKLKGVGNHPPPLKLTIRRLIMEELTKILNTRLDDYGLEIRACAVLNKIKKDELIELYHRINRFQSSLEDVIFNN